MFRILEVVGMLAPVAGIVIMVIYRRRATAGVVWGVAGAIVALIASVVGFLGPRLSLLGGGTDSGDALLDNLHSWALLRVALLLVSVILLVIGAFSGRDGTRTPVGWLAGGIPLVLVGFALTFVHVDFGADSEGASEIVGLLVETAQFALLGLGVLLLCLAVVSGRSTSDGRREPAQMVVGAAMQAKQFYDRAHARRR
ncbi:hypothetical protein [Tsukamurella pseudospumae]|uniref:Uncharacterized protein n=1 Tax=Tsukamurella pseudospumae TaxID=239498 RepID=A0A137YZK0_9ACTN|nr:hypothetical protein [Tsukamurella pseudospumae]KXO91303.1 hypothetical protein AXK61_07045 [Tsukamurella pseudospumae]